MKKNTLANAAMVFVIAVVLAFGVFAALQMRGEEGDALGSEFRASALSDNRLTSSANPENTCTVIVRCETVLDNLDLLDPAKAPYVPSDGIILPATVVEFAPGESAFDVLQRVCEAAKIQIEYSWTPLYDSYYVEGIAHLYEFDCGRDSGWMYEVNDGYPMYGSSSYDVQNGDVIEWRYTCVGLGEDIGAERVDGK